MGRPWCVVQCERTGLGSTRGIPRGGAWKGQAFSDRGSKHGLRGCRIGEASNPGPPSIRIGPEGVSKALVESLGQALTAVDTSNDRAKTEFRALHHEIGFFFLTKRRCSLQHVTTRGPDRFSAESVTPPEAQVASSRAASVVFCLMPKSPIHNSIGMHDWDA